MIGEIIAAFIIGSGFTGIIVWVCMRNYRLKSTENGWFIEKRYKKCPTCGMGYAVLKDKFKPKDKGGTAS